METVWMNHAKYRHIAVIDAHTGGEPLRVIADGFPKPEGKTILEKRRWVKEHADDLRKALMWEPRGHADMYGVLVTEPERDSSDFGVIFMHNEGYSTMCGHGIIGVTKVVLETGMFPMQEPETVLRIDSPAGQITAHAFCQNGEVTSVSFLNVPSFLYARDKEVVIDGFGKITYDIAFGGAFYAFVNADEYGIAMTPENVRQLIDLGMKIKYAVMESVPVKHPFDDDLSFLYGTIFYGKPHSPEADSRNVCIFANGEVDRSPTGTGVSARMALHYFKGELKADESMHIESIIGTRFKAEIHELTEFGPYPAVIPKVTGTAYIHGYNTILIDQNDPLKNGFFLR